MRDSLLLLRYSRGTISILDRSGLGVLDIPDLLFWDAWDAGESVDDFFEAEGAPELEATGWSAE